MVKLVTAVILLLMLVIADRASAACLPSATAVKHAFPGAHPIYSKREAGHKGEKCWFAGARAQVVASAQSRKVKTEVIAPRHAVPDLTRLASVMRALALPGDSFNDRFAASHYDSFNDRFAATTVALSRPSELQRMLDPVGVVP